MSDKRKTPPAPDARRKRVPPTIDLSATEVTPPAAAPEPPPAAQASAPVREEPVAVAPPPPPRQEPPRAEQAPPAASAPTKNEPRGNFYGALAAGVAGGAVVAAVFGALWYAGVLSSPTDTSGQLAAMQKQVQDLQSRPASAQPDPKAVDALTQRVARMESALANLPKGDGGMTERLAAAENAMKALGMALTALNQRSDDAAANAAKAREQADAAEKAVGQLRGSVQEAAKDASAAVGPAQLDALQQRLAALEQAAKSARDEIAKTTTDETATRLALSASALRNAAVAGTPYTAELAQAKALGAADARLAPLAAFAASGVPNAPALAQELRALVPAMMQASGAQAPQGGFLEKLQANASKLVRVQPVDAPPGDDPSAVLARIEIAAARADIGAALTDLARLPDAARAPSQGWIAKAKARQIALDAANALAADTARALGSK